MSTVDVSSVASSRFQGVKEKKPKKKNVATHRIAAPVGEAGGVRGLVFSRVGITCFLSVFTNGCLLSHLYGVQTVEAEVGGEASGGGNLLERCAEEYTRG